ncbi:MAG: hypothetical protein QM218_05350 [Candidatus Cloacimonadota bacterium]|nr:hypothetical protein [Candidatus Cloacimonadota bacterium]
MRNILSFAAMFLVFVQGWAVTITSTTAGGNWNNPATWGGGQIPTAYDDVVIAGPVKACDTHDCFCNHLTVNAGSFLYGGNGGGSEDGLYVYGNLTNHGTIRDHPLGWGMLLRSYGNITNSGSFTPEILYLHGTADQFISGSGNFSPLNMKDQGSASPVRLLSDLSMAGSRIDLNEGTLDLCGGGSPHTLSLSGGYIYNGFVHGGNGAALALSNVAKLYDLDIDECVFAGTVEIGSAVSVGILRNQGIIQSGNAELPVLTVTQLLENRGTIRNNPAGWYFWLELGGSLEDWGTISNRKLVLNNTQPRYLWQDANANPISCANLEAEEGSAPHELRSNLSLAGSGIELNEGTLDLCGGDSLNTFSLSGGYINNGFIHGGNGAALALSNGAKLYDLDIDECVFAGTVEIGSAVSVGILRNQGIIQSGNAELPVLTVTQLLENRGTIRNNTSVGWNFWLFLSGDLENYGTIANQRTVLNNTQPRYLWQDADANPISCANLEVEVGSAPHELRSNLSFAGGSTNLNGSTLIMYSGRSVHGITFTSGYFGNAVLETDGFSPITGSGVSLYNIQAEDLSFHGTVGIGGNVVIQDLVNYGYIEPRDNPVDITVNGNLVNYGTIRLYVNWTMNLYCRGNISNYGSINNRNVYMDGTADQYLLNAGSISVESFQLVSELGPAQWYFNGSLYSADVLTNRTINPNTLGVWQPLAGTVWGRLITIGSGLAELDAPGNLQAFLLGTEAKLQWDQVPGAVYYNVYASSDPYALFPADWETPIKAHDPDLADGIVRLDLSGAEPYKFYRVTAGNTMP